MMNYNTKIYKFKKGHILYKEDYPVIGLSIFFIKKGKVEVSFKLNNDKTFKITILENNFFGLFEALSEKQVRITSAKICEDSVICLWKKEDFLLNSNIIAELGLKAIFCLSNFLRIINQKIKEIG